MVIYTLIKMVKELKLYEEVAKELRIKASSFRRQINRIEAYYEEREAQKRSGRRRAGDYMEAMKKAIEKMLGRPILTGETGARRKIKFQELRDALKYSEPIAHIARVYKRKEEEEWELEIPDESLPGGFQG